MPKMDPFEGAKSEREEAQRALLETVATAGQAGKQAYDAARKETGTMRQGAIDRAAQRAQLTGQNLGGADVAAVSEAADRFGTYFTGQEAAHQAQLGQIGASGQSYLGKVGAIAPVMQQEALKQAAEREKQYQSQIAATQAEIDAQKAQALADHERQKELLLMKNQFDVQADARAQAAARSKGQAEAAADPTGGLTKAGILGAGQTLADAYGQKLGRPDVFSAEQAGRALAAYKGIPETVVNTVLGPRKDAPDAAKPPAYQDELTADVRGFAENPNDPGFLHYSAKKVADTTRVEGGEKIVRDILNDKDNQSDLREFYGLSQLPGKDRPSWNDVLAALQEEYLTPTKHGNIRGRTYAVMVEYLRGLPWRK